MDTQEIIDTLKMIQGLVEWEYPLDCYVYLDKAIETLEQMLEEQPKT